MTARFSLTALGSFFSSPRPSPRRPGHRRGCRPPPGSAALPPRVLQKSQPARREQPKKLERVTLCAWMCKYPAGEAGTAFQGQPSDSAPGFRFHGQLAAPEPPAALLPRRGGTRLPSQTSLEIPATRHPPPRQRLQTLRGPFRPASERGPRSPGAAATHSFLTATPPASAGDLTRAAAAPSRPRDKGLLSRSTRRRRPPAGTETPCDPTQISAAPPSSFLFLPVICLFSQLNTD